MRKDILISTTNTLENIVIEQYIETISTNVVIGANFFSDFKASFTDLFGGFSDSYQNKLEELYNVAIKNLQYKAGYIGANAIVGLKVDFDEISGKDKSMFMVSAVGTAVKISNCKGSNVSNQPITNISSTDLTNEVTKCNILQLLKNNEPPLPEHWQYLYNNSNDEITALLLDMYLLIQDKNVTDLSHNLTLLNNNTGQYFRRVDPNTAINILYTKITTHHSLIIKILKDNQLFSPKEVVKLIKEGDFKTAILCLVIDKEFYSTEDLLQMTEIVELFDNLPNTGEIKLVKGSLLSKEKEKFVCSSGHSSDIATEYCTEYRCGLNIKGLTPSQVSIMDKFKIKVDALKSLFSVNNKI